MKLSSAQQKVIDQAHREIQEARDSKDLIDYYTKYQAPYYHHQAFQDLDTWHRELIEEVYNHRIQGIVLTQASGPTIRKLESLGLIKILDDTTGTGSYRFDKVQVLNF